MQAVAVLAPQLGREADVLLPLLLRRMEEFRVAEAGLSAVDAATAQEAIFARLALVQQAVRHQRRQPRHDPSRRAARRRGSSLPGLRRVVLLVAVAAAAALVSAVGAIFIAAAARALLALSGGEEERLRRQNLRPARVGAVGGARGASKANPVKPLMFRSAICDCLS